MKLCNMYGLTGRIVFGIVFFFSHGLFGSISTFVNDFVSLKLKGQLSDQLFTSQNINVLSNAIADDQINYILTTLDCFVTAECGCNKTCPRATFYTDFRFQFAWGSYAEAMINSAHVDFVNMSFPVYPSRFNKHLLWMREAWVKILLGNQNSNTPGHFIQAGLIPFSLGRAIALGPAYETVGFLGFTPTYNIDQYAPGIVLSLKTSVNSECNIYTALLENEQDSLATILEPIHTMVTGGCPQRGIGQISYLVALQNKTSFKSMYGCNITMEPFLLYLSAPDKTLEFVHDIDSEVSTAGIAVEGEYKKFNWGFECAKNFGAVYIKPLDRNVIVLTQNPDDGTLIQKYNKIYTQDPATTLNPTTALVTDETTICATRNIENVLQNGKEICPGLWNAFDRFRPAQRVNLTGYYFIADVAFDYVPDVLQGALGVGYFSGADRVRVDFNKVSSGICLSQSFNGFVPLQSNYSGKRIRHFVMLNQGVPRYTLATPQQNFSVLNTTSSISIDTLDATTNLIFFGGRGSFFPAKFKKRKLLFAPNIIGYWAANTSYISDEDLPAGSPFLREINNYLGTEVNVEFSFDIVEQLRFTGYLGILFPGGYYKDIAGTIVKKYNLPIGADPVYIANFAIAYTF